MVPTTGAELNRSTPQNNNGENPEVTSNASTNPATSIPPTMNQNVTGTVPAQPVIPSIDSSFSSIQNTDISTLPQSGVSSIPTTQPILNSQATSVSPNVSNHSNENSIPVAGTSNFNANNTTAQQNPVQGTNNFTQEKPLSLEDEELLKVFIGENYEKFTTKSFNFSGFFFGSLYLFYRKMFSYALILIFIQSICSSLFHQYFFIISIVSNALVGLIVNPLYVSYAQKKILKIKLQNQNKSFNEIKDICFKKGGTSIWKLLLGILTTFVILIFIVIVSLILGFSSLIGNLFNQANFNYQGVLIYDSSIDMAQEFSISVPYAFNNQSNAYDYHYNYSGTNGVFNQCNFQFSAIKGYNSATDLLTQMREFNVSDNPSEISDAQINGLNWQWFSYKNSFGTTYYYGTQKKNKVYLLEYEIQKDAPSNCAGYRQQILNSLNSN